jgi:hypothetical protein
MFKLFKKRSRELKDKISWLREDIQKERELFYYMFKKLPTNELKAYYVDREFERILVKLKELEKEI